MKNIFAALLSLTLVVPPLIQAGIAIEFAIDQPQIAARYCVNKDKPQLHCNGKCELMKRLHLNRDKSGQPRQLPKTLRFELSAFLKTTKNNLDHFLLTFVKSPFPFYSEMKKSILCFDIFHPPRIF